MPDLKKILIIDDSETNNILIRSLFEEKHHYKVKSLDNATLAHKTVLDFQPDIILLDLMMPVKDGFMVLEDLKSDQKTSHIPVIVVSARQESTDIERAKQLGAVDYIRKPIGNNSLLEKVEHFLSRETFLH